MKDFTPPDPRAPRFRKKAAKTYADGKLFKNFIKKYPEYKGKITRTEFSQIIQAHGSLLSELVRDNRDGVELPQRLGHVFVGTCNPPYRKNVNFKVSAEYAKVLMNRNYESDSYVAKIFYSNYGNRFSFKNGELWEFKGYREFTRAVAHHYPKNWNKYVFIDRNKKLSIVYRKQSSHIDCLRSDEELLKYYNEFEID